MLDGMKTRVDGASILSTMPSAPVPRLSWRPPPKASRLRVLILSPPRANTIASRVHERSIRKVNRVFSLTFSVEQSGSQGKPLIPLRAGAPSRSSHDGS